MEKRTGGSQPPWTGGGVAASPFESPGCMEFRACDQRRSRVVIEERPK
jgi:hypothetical protein